MLLETDGDCWVVSHTDDSASCVDDWIAYEWHKLDTLNFDLMHQLSAVVKTKLQAAARVHRLGIQFESVSSLLQQTLDEALHPSVSIPIDSLLSEVQRCKDLDELEAQRAAMLKAGERVFHDGDYQCGERHGPARNRQIKRGELYILDGHREREGILQVGDVVCVEPGGYTPEARCGVRIENTYLSTESGAETLSEYPVTIVPMGHSSSTRR